MLPSQAAENPARYSAADKLHQDITQLVGGHIHILNDLRRTVLLPASDLSRMATVLAELQAHLKQLELFERELRHLATPYSAMPYSAAVLVIVQQPFPKIMKQNGSIVAHDEHLAVRLLSCARTRAVALSPVKAELRFEDYQFKTVDSPVENNTQPLDARQRANFDAISFPQGSRGKAVRLHFSVQVAFYPAGGDPGAALHSVPTTLQSDPSAPFVVLTNESQWEAGAGMLLQKEVYPSGSTIVSWPFFANVLQMHYITAMRQDPVNVQRPLSKAELAWIHETRLEGKSSLHMSCFEQLWEWLGKVMQKLRHQRLLNALWLRGYIFGFCQKSQAEALLSTHSQGAFLLRFAENSPGAFAVAYVSTTPSTGERLVGRD